MGSVSYDRKRASVFDGDSQSVNWGSWGSRTGYDIVWTQIYDGNLYTFESVVYRIAISWGTSQALTGLTVGIPLGEVGRSGSTSAIVRGYLYTTDPTTRGTSAPSGYIKKYSSDQATWSERVDGIPEVPGVKTQEYSITGLSISNDTNYLYLWIDAIYDVLGGSNEGVNIYVVSSANGTSYGYCSATFREPANVTVTYNSNDAEGTIANMPSTEVVTQGNPISSKIPTNTYTIKLDANGGSASSTKVDSTRAFKSWNTIADGSGVAWSPGQTLNQAIPLTLFAQWGNPSTVNLPVATRAGYDFLGWGTTKDATTLYNGTYTPTRPLTLFAVWKQQGVIHIYSSADSKWHSYITWVYTGDSGGPNNNGWHHAIPMIYSGSKFHICG